MKHSRFTGKKLFGTATFVLALTAVTFVSCSTFGGSTPKTPPSENLTDREIVQLAQTAYDEGHTQLSEYYYKLLLQRYGNNTYDYIEGRYELAHLALKRKDYRTAVPMLKEVLEIYDASLPGTLPGSYKKLAEIDLAKVPEATLKEIEASLPSSAESASYDPFDDSDSYDNGDSYDDSYWADEY